MGHPQSLADASPLWIRGDVCILPLPLFGFTQPLFMSIPEALSLGGGSLLPQRTSNPEK